MLVPMMPPPMITTSARAGSTSSERTGSTRGAMGSCGGQSIAACTRLAYPVEPRGMPRVGRHEVGDVGERHAARRIRPGIGGPGAAHAPKVSGAPIVPRPRIASLHRATCGPSPRCIGMPPIASSPRSPVWLRVT